MPFLCLVESFCHYRKTHHHFLKGIKYKMYEKHISDRDAYRDASATNQSQRNLRKASITETPQGGIRNIDAFLLSVDRCLPCEIFDSTDCFQIGRLLCTRLHLKICKPCENFMVRICTWKSTGLGVAGSEFSGSSSPVFAAGFWSSHDVHKHGLIYHDSSSRLFVCSIRACRIDHSQDSFLRYFT